MGVQLVSAVPHNKRYSRQTPAGLSGSPSKKDSSKGCSSGEYSSVDFYVEQIQDLHGQLTEMGVSCWVGDGFYAKRKVFRAITEMDGDLITRLRSDANLRQATAIYTGPRKEGPGAPKLYDGKINFDCPDQIEDRFEEIGRLPDRTHIEIWTTLPTARTSSETFASFCSGTNERNALCSSARLTRSRRPQKLCDTTACAIRLSL
jgi:hypothetical protein